MRVGDARVGLALVILAAALLVSSTGGVSSMAVERSVAVDVVDDEHAMVGLEVVNESTEAVEIRVENRLEEDLVVTAESENDADDTVIDSGAEATLAVAIECDDEPVPVEVTAEGETVTVERTLEREPCNG